MLLLSNGEGLRLDADGRTRRLNGEIIDGSFLQALDQHWQALRCDHHDGHYPFRGGWALYLGYELAAQIEPTLSLARDSQLPIALALRAPAAILRDRLSGEVLALAEREHAHWLAQIDADLVQAGDEALVGGSSIIDDLIDNCRVSEDPPETYLAAVTRTLEYLRAGDVFQANLSRGWQLQFEQTIAPALVYAKLRTANPAPFAGLLMQPDWALASSSPERLVSVRGRHVETRPIAGTRPRLVNEDSHARIHELISHPKERAEHVMLIDLERNDLGRVCRPGSVRVDELMSIESYAHVHHIVSNVSGELRDDVTPGQLIAATFPGGTITGCPKVRCMQIIAELENTPRGPYTGAMGYLNRDGDIDLNILIRTFLLRGKTISLRAGAGIVIDSDPQRELQETRAKARGLLRALNLPS